MKPCEHQWQHYFGNQEIRLNRCMKCGIYDLIDKRTPRPAPDQPADGAHDAGLTLALDVIAAMQADIAKRGETATYSRSKEYYATQYDMLERAERNIQGVSIVATFAGACRAAGEAAQRGPGWSDHFVKQMGRTGVLCPRCGSATTNPGLGLWCPMCNWTLSNEQYIANGWSATPPSPDTATSVAADEPTVILTQPRNLEAAKQIIAATSQPAPAVSAATAPKAVKLTAPQRKALEMLAEKPRMTGRKFYNSYIPGQTAQSLERLKLATRHISHGYQHTYEITPAGRAALEALRR